MRRLFTSGLRTTGRTLALGALACGLAGTASGCRWLQSGTPTIVAPRTPAGQLPERQPAELVGYLNTQASYLQSITYDDVRATAFENGKELGNLNDSTLYSVRPRNFRLIGAHAIAGTQIDIGSNDSEFWMYAKPIGRDNYFYCSHDAFGKGDVKFPIPFDTDWVMQALGMADYNPADVYEVKPNEAQQAYVLYQKTQTRTGMPIVKATIFNADWDEGRKPVVRKHAIFDERDTSKPIAIAEILAVKTISVGTDPATGKSTFVQVPTEVNLEWPQQSFRMTMKLGKERVNDDLRDRMTALFNRPQIRGTNPIDLAKYQLVIPSSNRGQMPDRTR